MVHKVSSEIEDFRIKLSSYFDVFKNMLATDRGDWIVKGFIDIYRNIYTISVDTKVVSKIIELMLFPIISQFAIENKYKMLLCDQQNYYPDISLITPNETKIALDLKTTYRIDKKTVKWLYVRSFYRILSPA